MRVSREHPPNYEEIVKAFPHVARKRNVVFTFGDTIYAPGGSYVSLDLLRHEEIHSVQQAIIGPDKWWEKYLSDPQFRLYEEADAYRVQYRSMNRADRRKHLSRLARDLSSGMYGRIVDFEEAKELITS